MLDRISLGGVVAAWVLQGYNVKSVLVQLWVYQQVQLLCHLDVCTTICVCCKPKACRNSWMIRWKLGWTQVWTEFTLAPCLEMSGNRALSAVVLITIQKTATNIWPDINFRVSPVMLLQVCPTIKKGDNVYICIYNIYLLKHSRVQN